MVVLAAITVSAMLWLCLKRGKKITAPVADPLDKGKLCIRTADFSTLHAASHVGRLQGAPQYWIMYKAMHLYTHMHIIAI